MNSFLDNVGALLKCSCLPLNKNGCIVQYVMLNFLRVLIFYLYATVEGRTYHNTIVSDNTRNFGTSQNLFLNSNNYFTSVGRTYSKELNDESTHSTLPTHRHSQHNSRHIPRSTQQFPPERPQLLPNQNIDNGRIIYRPGNDYSLDINRTVSFNRVSDSIQSSDGRKLFSHTLTSPAGRHQQQGDLSFNETNLNVPAVHTGSTQYTEVTNEVLLQTYKARSRCFMSKLHWVRDEDNCAVFFVCARHRIAAVLTCPDNEVWSNRVTNCVPARSRWDDCPAYRHESQRIGTRNHNDRSNYITSRTTTVHPITSSFPDDNYYDDNALLSSRRFESDEFNRRHNRRMSERNQHTDKRNKRIDITNRSRRRGEVVQKVQNSSERRFIFATSSSETARQASSSTVGKESKHRNTLSRAHFLNKLKQHGEFINNEEKDNAYDIVTQNWLDPHTHKENRNPPLPHTTSPPILNSVTKRRYRFNKSGHALHRQHDHLGSNVNMKPLNDLKFGYKLETQIPKENEPVFNVAKSQGEADQSVSLGVDVQEENLNPSDAGWWIDVVTIGQSETTTETPDVSTVPQSFTESPPTAARQEYNSTFPPHVIECGVSVTSMIVGGLPARQGRWPWVVSLQLSWARRHVCGATLVHPQWVVTAAHCVAGPDFNAADEWRAVFWQHGSSQTVDYIAKHPSFVNGDNYPNDIALLRLSKPADVTSFDVRHACLPSSEKEQKEWEECWIMGWGEAKDNVETELKELEVKIRKNSECSARWGWKRILNSHVCVGNGDRGACNGDSGGPLICRKDGYHYLAGVTSWGVSGCQTMGYPSVFTRVAYYTDWIQNVIDAHS